MASYCDTKAGAAGVGELWGRIKTRGYKETGDLGGMDRLRDRWRNKELRDAAATSRRGRTLVFIKIVSTVPSCAERNPFLGVATDPQLVAHLDALDTSSEGPHAPAEPSTKGPSIFSHSHAVTNAKSGQSCTLVDDVRCVPFG